MKPVIYSEGFMMTSVNNEIMDAKKYKATYDGKKGKMILNNNNDTYYIEANDRDLENILAGSRNLKIDNELEKLNDKHYTPNKTRKKKKKKKKKKRRKKKTSTKKKSPTKKKTKKSLLDKDFLKTIL